MNDITPASRTDLYPDIEAFDSGMLPVDALHTLYWEQSGTRGMLLHPARRGWSAHAAFDRLRHLRSARSGRSDDNNTTSDH
jgi:hypothetical protein